MGDANLDWLASYGFDVLVEAEVEKATAHQTITLGTGTEFRIGQGDGAAHVKNALPKGTNRRWAFMMAADLTCQLVLGPLHVAVLLDYWPNAN